MQPPTCRICGEKHWTNAPHKFNGSGPDRKVDRAGAAVPEKVHVRPGAKNGDKADVRVVAGDRVQRRGKSAPVHRRGKDPERAKRRKSRKKDAAPTNKKQRWDREKYNAYMRKLMQERRAAARR